jgi:hypothetical protein
MLPQSHAKVLILEGSLSGIIVGVLGLSGVTVAGQSPVGVFETTEGLVGQLGGNVLLRVEVGS